MQSLEDRSSHSSNSAEALYAFQMINQLVNKIFANSEDLYYATMNAVDDEIDVVSIFPGITFSQFC
jgi:hypothetical protein